MTFMIFFKNVARPCEGRLPAGTSQGRSCVKGERHFGMPGTTTPGYPGPGYQ